MKLFILILFIPVAVMAENSLLQQAIDNKVSMEIKNECETCTFDIQYKSSPIEMTEKYSIKSVAASHWKGETKIIVKIDSKSIVDVGIPVNIRWFDKVVIAKNNIRHGKLIEKNDLKVINKDITFNKAAYINELSKAVGKIGKRGFRRGQIIDENVLKLPKVVRYGQPIKIKFEQGHLKMTVMGKARGAGSVGEVIPVMISKTKKKVMAKIIDKSSARIE